MILINHNNHNDQRSINTWIISGMHSLVYGEFYAFCLVYEILYCRCASYFVLIHINFLIQSPVRGAFFYTQIEDFKSLI